jgi:hypothetical protein
MRRIKDTDITAEWRKKLKNIPCFIIGNSASLRKADLSCLKKYCTIGINRAFKLIDPTFLIWQDLALWSQHKKEIKKLKAIKYCRKSSDPGGKGFYHFQMTGRDHKLPPHPGSLYGRGSSGPLAYAFAYSLGCNPIVLVGMDCWYDKKGNTDFYGKNPMHRPHTIPYCHKGLKWIFKNQHKRKIINCSRSGKYFKESISLEKALKIVGPPLEGGRKEIIKKVLGK